MLNRLIATQNDILPLILRLALGVVMFPHGAQKLLGWFGGGGFAATMQGMSAMGMPKPLVFLIIIGEALGALGLLTGFLTRFCAASIGLIMLGAIALVHAKFGFFMNWAGRQAGEGFEYHLLALGIALALVVRGGGAASIDHALQRRQ